MCESRLIRLSVTWNSSGFWNAANCGRKKEISCLQLVIGAKNYSSQGLSMLQVHLKTDVNVTDV